MQCCYNTVSIFQNTHNSHPIAGPLRQVTGLWGVFCEFNSGAHFTNNFFIVIKILWRSGFSVIPSLYVILSLPNFAHATTA